MGANVEDDGHDGMPKIGAKADNAVAITPIMKPIRPTISTSSITSMITGMLMIITTISTRWCRRADAHA